MRPSRLFLLLAPMAACTFGPNVNKDGEYPHLFPKTPLSESPCLEDQDCIVTHLIDGQCCPDPSTSASNLYTRDQFQQLLAHQKDVCNDPQEPYTCPEHPPAGHIDVVIQGACVQKRCVKKEVPADAPHIPTMDPTSHPEIDTSKAGSVAPSSPPIETVASPKPD